MKKTTAIIFSLSLFFFASYTVLKTSGSHPGSTGAPLDLDCSQSGCHSDAVVINNAVNNTTLTFSSVDSSYIPGQTYSLTLKGYASVPVSKFGFEIVALKDNDSLNVGQFVLTDAARTQIIDHMVGSDTRFSVTHKTAGTPATTLGSTQWTFDWTAPSFDAGKITFWYAVNFTNNNGQNTGDRIYLNSFTIHPALNISVAEIADVYEFNAFYNQSSKEINVSWDLKGTRETELSISDATGKVVWSLPKRKSTGRQVQSVKAMDFKSGTYFIRLSVGSQTSVKKILVD